MAERELSEVMADVPFADLTIKCKDKTFEAHRALICRKSEVLTTALAKNLKVCLDQVLSLKLPVSLSQESRSQELTLDDDDPEIVERMLRFCYTEEYDLDTTEKSLKDKPSLDLSEDQTCQSDNGGHPTSIAISGVRQSPCVDSTSSNETDSTLCPPTDVPDVRELLIHSSVYVLADKYAIWELKALAKIKFQKICKPEDLPMGFARVVRHVFSSTPSADSDLRPLVIETCMLHLDTLMLSHEFITLMEQETEVACCLLVREWNLHRALKLLMSSTRAGYTKHINEVKEDLTVAKKDDQKTKETLDATQKQVQKLQEDLSLARKSDRKAKEDLSSAQQQVKKLVTDISVTQKSNQQANQNLDTNQKQILKLQEDLSVAQKSSQQTEEDLGAARRQILKLKEDLSVAQNSNQKLKVDLGAAQQRTRTAQESERSYKTILEILNHYEACRHCGEEFNYEFRSGEDCIRCEYCDTRHW